MAGVAAALSALDAWAREQEVHDINAEAGWELNADNGEFQGGERLHSN